MSSSEKVTQCSVLTHEHSKICTAGTVIQVLLLFVSFNKSFSYWKKTAQEVQQKKSDDNNKRKKNRFEYVATKQQLKPHLATIT